MATYCKMQRVDCLVSLITFNDESIRKVEHKKKTISLLSIANGTHLVK